MYHHIRYHKYQSHVNCHFVSCIGRCECTKNVRYLACSTIKERENWHSNAIDIQADEVSQIYIGLLSVWVTDWPGNQCTHHRYGGDCHGCNTQLRPLGWCSHDIWSAGTCAAHGCGILSGNLDSKIIAY